MSVRHFAQKDVASERRRSGRRGGVLSPRGRWALISSANMLYSGWPGSDVRHRWTRVPAVSSSPCACEGALKERKFWPGQCRMRDKTVEKLLMLRPGETFHQEGIPLARGLGPLLSTPPPAPLVTAASGDPVQSIQVVAGNLGPQIGTTRNSKSTLAREVSRALTQPSAGTRGLAHTAGGSPATARRSRSRQSGRTSCCRPTTPPPAATRPRPGSGRLPR